MRDDERPMTPSDWIFLLMIGASLWVLIIWVVRCAIERSA